MKSLQKFDTYTRAYVRMNWVEHVSIAVTRGWVVIWLYDGLQTDYKCMHSNSIRPYAIQVQGSCNVS